MQVIVRTYSKYVSFTIHDFFDTKTLTIMLNSEHLTETIDAYLNGTMSVEDINIFENALTEQPELKHAMAAQKLIRFGLKQSGKVATKNLFKQFHAEMLEEEQANEMANGQNYLQENSTQENSTKVVVFDNRRRYTIISIAASVILCLGVGLAVFFNNHKEAQNIAENQQVTKIEYIEQNSDAQGFAPLTSTGKDYKTLILMKTDTYDKPHYEFIHRDTITLFSNSLNPQKDNLQLIFDNQTNVYKLSINAKVYEIEQGFKGIKELK